MAGTPERAGLDSRSSSDNVSDKLSDSIQSRQPQRDSNQGGQPHAEPVIIGPAAGVTHSASVIVLHGLGDCGPDFATMLDFKMGSPKSCHMSAGASRLPSRCAAALRLICLCPQRPIVAVCTIELAAALRSNAHTLAAALICLLPSTRNSLNMQLPVPESLPQYVTAAPFAAVQRAVTCNFGMVMPACFDVHTLGKETLSCQQDVGGLEEAARCALRLCCKR
jgi:hypothetical protein